MIWLFLLLALDRSGEVEFTRLVKLYLKYPSKDREDVIIERYKGIRPLGLDTYIRFLKARKDDKGIKEEMGHWIDYLVSPNTVLKKHDEAWVAHLHRLLTNGLISIKGKPYYLKLLSRYVPVLERYLSIETYKDRRTRLVLNICKNRLITSLKRDVPADSLYAYRKGLIPLIKNMREKYEYILLREDEEKKKRQWFNLLANGAYGEAIQWAKGDYEKGIALLLSGRVMEGKTYVKRAILDDSLRLLPVFICLNRDEKDAVILLKKILFGDGDSPASEPGITLYNLYERDIVLEPLDTFLIPYSLYFHATKDKNLRDSILEKYPFTSPAFILRVLRNR